MSIGNSGIVISMLGNLKGLGAEQKGIVVAAIDVIYSSKKDVDSKIISDKFGSVINMLSALKLVSAEQKKTVTNAIDLLKHEVSLLNQKKVSGVLTA